MWKLISLSLSAFLSSKRFYLMICHMNRALLMTQVHPLSQGQNFTCTPKYLRYTSTSTIDTANILVTWSSPYHDQMVSPLVCNWKSLSFRIFSNMNLHMNSRIKVPFFFLMWRSFSAPRDPPVDSLCIPFHYVYMLCWLHVDDLCLDWPFLFSLVLIDSPNATTTTTWEVHFRRIQVSTFLLLKPETQKCIRST